MSKRKHSDNRNTVDFKTDIPRTEMDVPLVYSGKPKREEVSPLELATEEKEKQRQQARYFSAFKLVIGCLVFLGIIYVLQLWSLWSDKSKVVQISKEIIEIIKTLLYTLSGYLFARHENKDG